MAIPNRAANNQYQRRGGHGRPPPLAVAALCERRLFSPVIDRRYSGRTAVRSNACSGDVPIADCRRWGHQRYRINEPVSAPRQRLDETRIIGGIVQRLADFVDGLVEPVLEIHKRVRGPQRLLQFLARHDLARTLEQHGQNFEGLFLELDLCAVFAQLSRAKIDFVDSEPNQVWKGGEIRHGRATPACGGVYHSLSSHSTILQHGDDERRAPLRWEVHAAQEVFAAWAEGRTQARTVD